MPKNVRTALGDVIDFDMLILKQKIADAPMNIEVQRRKEFIDSKEGKARGTRASQPEVASADASPAEQPVKPVDRPIASDFEVEGAEPTPKKRK